MQEAALQSPVWTFMREGLNVFRNGGLNAADLIKKPGRALFSTVFIPCDHRVLYMPPLTYDFSPVLANMGEKKMLGVKCLFVAEILWLRAWPVVQFRAAANHTCILNRDAVTV